MGLKSRFVCLLESYKEFSGGWTCVGMEAAKRYEDLLMSRNVQGEH